MASTTLTVTGTPTVFLPLTTAWPLGTDCTSNIYLHGPVADPSTFLAWDPIYGERMVASAQSCLPPQVTSWWDQGTTATPYTALGPTFVCPEAYSPVQTAIVASSLLQTFCCPSGGYSFLVPQKNTAGAFPSQCVSTITAGETFTYLANNAQTDQFTNTITMNATSAILFAIPVNGFNLATDTTSTSASTTAYTTHSSSSTVAVTSTSQTTSSPTPSSTASSSPSSASPSLGESVGISVGAVVAVLILALVAFLVWRRRKRARQMPPEYPFQQVHPPGGAPYGAMHPEAVYYPQNGFASVPPVISPTPKEMPSAQTWPHELAS